MYENGICHVNQSRDQFVDRKCHNHIYIFNFVSQLFRKQQIQKQNRLARRHLAKGAGMFVQYSNILIFYHFQVKSKRYKMLLRPLFGVVEQKESSVRMVLIKMQDLGKRSCSRREGGEWVTPPLIYGNMSPGARTANSLFVIN